MLDLRRAQPLQLNIATGEVFEEKGAEVSPVSLPGNGLQTTNLVEEGIEGLELCGNGARKGGSGLSYHALHAQERQ